MSEPDFVHVLSSGGTVNDDVVGPHPLEIEEIDCQVREMEQSRAAAEVSSRDYLIT
jgi:hypothetical protein